MSLLNPKSDPVPIIRRRHQFNTLPSEDRSTVRDDDDEPEADTYWNSSEHYNYPSPVYSSYDSPTSGWPVDIYEVCATIYHIVLVGYGTLFSGFFQAGNDMALGILRFFGGGASGSTGRDESEDGIRMEGRTAGDDNGKVKRRRKAPVPEGDKEYYPGMLNLSGTLCYMNSVLQSLASVPSLITHLERNVELAVELDVPTPVADTLLEVLQDLNTPHSRPRRAIRPSSLLSALSTLPAIRRLLGTREQQDAHELFLVLAEAISTESLKVAGEVSRSRGLGEVLTLQKWVAGKTPGVATRSMKAIEGARKTVKRQRGLAQPWEGLMARRRVCRVCGWCEATRMEPLGGMELSLPQSGDVSLDACIAQYLAPELLSDVTCELCSLKRTHAHYTAEYDRLSNPASSSSIKSPPIRPGSGSFGALEDLPSNPPSAPNTEMTAARRKRAKEAKRLETRLSDMVASGTVSHFGESLLPPSSSGPSTAAIPIKWQTVHTESVRAALITRPPQTLRLHLIRSEYTPYGVLLKKSARVGFPLILDLTRFVTRGIWDERRGVLGALATAEAGGEVVVQKRVLYRLESVILHYGYTHSSGHYVCIRRKPTVKTGEDGLGRRPVNVTKSCSDGCTCEPCLYFGPVRDEPEGGNVPGKGWLRISDDEIEEVGAEALVAARSQVFMLFYERVGECLGVEKKEVAVSTESEGEAPVRREEREEDYGQGRKTPDEGI